jgi:hypothetical protein
MNCREPRPRRQSDGILGTRVSSTWSHSQQSEPPSSLWDFDTSFKLAIRSSTYHRLGQDETLPLALSGRARSRLLGAGEQRH